MAHGPRSNDERTERLKKTASTFDAHASSSASLRLFGSGLQEAEVRIASSLQDVWAVSLVVGEAPADESLGLSGQSSACSTQLNHPQYAPRSKPQASPESRRCVHRAKSFHRAGWPPDAVPSALPPWEHVCTTPHLRHVVAKRPPTVKHLKKYHASGPHVHLQEA